MTAIFSRVRLNARQMAAMVVFVILASLISRNTSDVTMIQTFLTMLFRIGVLTPMMAVIGLVLAIAFTGRLAIMLVIAVPVLTTPELIASAQESPVPVMTGVPAASPVCDAASSVIVPMISVTVFASASWSGRQISRHISVRISPFMSYIG